MMVPMVEAVADGKGANLARGSGVALWRQIEQAMAGEIERGLWPVGEKLPTEPELAQRFGVNRHTLRRAMQMLEERGLVRVEQGRGTFVSEHVLDYPVAKRTRFSAIIARQRREPASRLLRADEVPAPLDVARELGLRAGAPVLLLERLNLVDGRPTNVGQHYFPLRRVPGFVAHYREHQSITRALQACGIADYTRRSTRVIARMPSVAEARLLQQPRNRAVLVTESLNVDPDGRPLEYGLGVFAGDRVQLTFEP